MARGASRPVNATVEGACAMGSRLHGRRRAEPARLCAGRLWGRCPEKCWSGRLTDQLAHDREELRVQAPAAHAGEPARAAGDPVRRLADQGVAPVLAADSQGDNRDDSGHDPPRNRATVTATTTPDMAYSRTPVPRSSFHRTRYLPWPGWLFRPGWCSWTTASPSVHDAYLLSDTYRRAW